MFLTYYVASQSLRSTSFYQKPMRVLREDSAQTLFIWLHNCGSESQEYPLMSRQISCSCFPPYIPDVYAWS